jgi:hypothetical protein
MEFEKWKQSGKSGLHGNLGADRVALIEIRHWSMRLRECVFYGRATQRAAWCR